MDVQRLRTLRELAIRGTMAAVAEVIKISPSAVSQQISLLEDEVGLPLIERRGRGVTITPAGEVLINHAGRILNILEEAKTDIAELKMTVAGELVLAAFPSIAASLLPGSLRGLQLRYPDLNVSGVEMEPLVGLASLRSWQVDLAIVDDLTLKQDKNPETLETFPIYEDRIVTIFHKDHPLATREDLDLLDLQHEFWAIDTRPNTFSDTLFAMCADRGFSPKVIGRFDGFEVISAMVASQCAISLLPRIRTNLHSDHLISRELDPPIERTIILAIRKGESRRPTLKILIDSLRDHAKDIRSTAMPEYSAIKR